MNTYYTKKLLNYGFKMQLKELLPYLLLALLIMCEALFFSCYVSNSLLSIVISLIVCPITYIVICYKTRLDAFVELENMIKKSN